MLSLRCTIETKCYDVSPISHRIRYRLLNSHTLARSSKLFLVVCFVTFLPFQMWRTQRTFLFLCVSQFGKHFAGRMFVPVPTQQCVHSEIRFIWNTTKCVHVHGRIQMDTLFSYTRCHHKHSQFSCNVLYILLMPLENSASRTQTNDKHFSFQLSNSLTVHLCIVN